MCKTHWANVSVLRNDDGTSNQGCSNERKCCVSVCVCVICECTRAREIKCAKCFQRENQLSDGDEFNEPASNGVVVMSV